MDEFILNEIPDRSRKGKSPAHACPTGRWSGPEALQLFVQAVNKASDYCSPGGFAHTSFLTRSSARGTAINGYWPAASHGARHTDQIREVKANPNFPANQD